MARANLGGTESDSEYRTVQIGGAKRADNYHASQRTFGGNEYYSI